nr:hypothetical protein [uncultured bacterium]
MIKNNLLFIVLLCSFLLNCGGGGGKYFPPQIAINKIGLQKEEIKSSNKAFEHKILLELDLNSEFPEYFDFAFKDKTYRLRFNNKNFVSIVDSNNKFIKKIEIPRYPINAGALELIDQNNKSYLAVYVDQQPTSHSSTLFILNDNMEVLYKEHLLGALWMARQNTGKGHNLILSAETKWIPKNKWISVGGPWRYMFAN